MSPLSTLPDLFLLAILDRVPVHDLYLTVPLVCKRWTNLRKTACHRRKTLILVESETHLPIHVQTDSEFKFDPLKYAVREDGTPFQSETISAYYRNSCLVFPYYFAKQPKVIRLTRLFPKLETLKIIQYNISMYELCKVIQALESWSLGKSIKKLQLLLQFTKMCWTEDLMIKLYVSKVMAVINGPMKPTLKNLFLNFAFPHRGFTEKVSIDLKILSQLESFSYGLYGLDDDKHDVDEPLRALQTYNSKSLRKIVISSPLKLESLVKLSPEIARKFLVTDFEEEIDRENVENFKLFCTQFTSLTVLNIKIGGRERFFRQVVRSVAELKNLIHLSVKIDLNVEDEDDEDKVSEVPQLPSVIALSLFIETKSHSNFALLNLPAIMPNVQVVHIRHDSPLCAECDYGPFSQKQLESFVKQDNPIIAQMQKCMKLARRPLIEFEKLRNLGVNKMPMMYMNFYVKDDADYSMELTRDELISEL